jgi:hypothetical protein
MNGERKKFRARSARTDTKAAQKSGTGRNGRMRERKLSRGEGEGGKDSCFSLRYWSLVEFKGKRTQKLKEELGARG